MANLEKQVPENVPGDFFVDSTCIDCDACRQIAASVFGEAADMSFVKAQPVSSVDRRQALRALLACPTGSIGCLGDDDVKAVMKDFPLAILTHRDDVADAERFAGHFAARRIIHQQELSSQPGAETVLEGEGPWRLAPGFLAIATAGHTQGHCVLLFQDRFLFTGDHLSWSRDSKQLSASKDYCWFSWPMQAESMARLADYHFEWVLPGHGQKVYLPDTEMRRHVNRLARSMSGEFSNSAQRS